MVLLAEIRQSWGWTGLDPVEVVAENDFGNLIVKDNDSRHWRLTPKDDECHVIATSRSELDALFATNLRKYGVAFEEATTVFRDALSVSGADPDHSIGERRFITFGVSSIGRLIAVSHHDEAATIRIINARPARRRERKIYEEG